MKRRIFYILAAILAFFPALLLSGCFGTKTVSYLCALPENSFEAELTYQIDNTIKNYSVIHRTENVNGTEYLIHYLHYHDNHSTEYIYLGVWNVSHAGGQDWSIYKLNESNQWVLGSEAKDIDGHEIYGTDRYNFNYYTAEFNECAISARGYHFNKERSLVEENDKYIMYNLGGSDIFKISNNIYHICLYRDHGTDTIWKHEFTKFTFNVSETAIPRISTFDPATLPAA